MTGNSNVPEDIAVELSKRAKKINIRKLESVPWAHDGSHPSPAWFWNFFILILLFPWTYLFRDKEVEKYIIDHGGKIGSSVSKNTFKVIVKALDDDTGKANKGRALNILMLLDNFKQTFVQ